MSKRKGVVLLVLIFMLVTVSVFAGRGNQSFGRGFSDTGFVGRGAYAVANDTVDTENLLVDNTNIMARGMARQQLRTPGEDCLLGEDCLYLETGERQGQYQVDGTIGGQRRNYAQGFRAR